MGWFNGISLRETPYDSVKDSGYEFIGPASAFDSSEGRAKSKLEAVAKTMGATVVFGVTYRTKGPIAYLAFGDAYRKKPVDKSADKK
jgi:hypothetical protein